MHDERRTRIAAAAVLAIALTGACAAAMQYDPGDHSFFEGDKRLHAGRTGFDIVASGKRICSAGYYFNTQYKSYMRERELRKKQTENDPAAKRTTFTARIPLDKEGTRTAGFSSAVWLQEDGTVRMTTRITFDTATDRKLYKNGEIQIGMDRAALAGEVIRMGARTFEVPADAPEKGGIIFNGGPTRLEYYATDPAKSFVIRTRKGGNRVMYAGESRATLETRIRPEDDQTDFVFELPPSGIEPEPPSDNAWAGIDFPKRDGFRVPNYRLCRNLVQNPSFEAGFHYWAPGQVGGTFRPDFDDFAAIDDTAAFKGTRSLRMRIRKGETPPMPSQFTIPVEKGKTYSFSFYAKADRENVRTSVLSVTQFWPQFPLSKRITLTTDWQRYSFEVTATNRLMSIGLGERWWDEEAGDQIDGATIWIDCVQFEEGPLTDYTEKPLLAGLATGRFGNTYHADEPRRPQLTLHNTSGTAREVNVAVTVKDFFGRQRHREVFKASLPAQAADRRTLALDTVTGTGYYQLVVDLDDGTFRDTDYFRFAVIRPLDNTHRNKNLFSGNGTIGRAMWLPRKLDLLKRVGIGSVINWTPLPSQALYELMAQNRIRTLSSITQRDRIGRADLKKKETYTPAGLRLVEEEAYNTVRKHPGETYWKLRNEPEHLPWEGITWEEMAAGFAAAYRGIKRGNPSALVISPDPCNMYKRARNWLENYFNAGGLKTFDILATHPYRPTPEDPDMDADARRFIELADRWEFKGPIWWTEGIYYAPYTLAEIGITAYKGCSSDTHRWAPLSYDIGRSERLAAAWTARSFLVGLKYHSRVDMNVDWSSGGHYFLDMDMTMRPVLFAANTLGNILGNAVYRQDVDLGAGIRCYLFEDEQRRPVAAIWNHDIKVNKFETAPPTGLFPFSSGEVTVLDFMMERLKLPDGQSFELPVTPCPVFVMGKPGTFPAFAAALEKAVIQGAELTPFLVAAHMEGSRAEITLQSLLSRGVKGTCEILLGDATAGRAAIDVKGKSEQKVSVDLAAYLMPGRITDVPLAVRFTNGDGAPRTIDGAFRAALCPRRTAPITVDGRATDWAPLPGIPLGRDHLKFFRAGQESWRGDGDLSAVLKTAWDEQGFYMCVDVADDTLDLVARGKNQDWYERDSVQTYFDTWADARFRTERGFDNNDYSYEFALTEAGAQAYRRFVPEWQIAFLKTGKPDKVQTAVARTGNHTVYEVFIPKQELVPVDFKPGTSFGFAILVNDKDNDYRKQGLTLTPAGTEPYMNPHLFPVWVLQK
ncbi:MAG: carbohydrate binding domain-containing protein [Kiritimatiellae bacterium]|nr:carbohydrate binding domain-containing protein [Kiritimatiellia bacterium]